MCLCAEKMSFSTQWQWPKFFIERCLHRLSKLVSGQRKGKQVTGESFGRHVSLFFTAVCFPLFFGAACVFYVSFSSSGPPDDCPCAHLKVSMHYEAPTPH